MIDDLFSYRKKGEIHLKYSTHKVCDCPASLGPGRTNRRSAGTETDVPGRLAALTRRIRFGCAGASLICERLIIKWGVCIHSGFLSHFNLPRQANSMWITTVCSHVTHYCNSTTLQHVSEIRQNEHHHPQILSDLRLTRQN
jgi:hypothetical protein